MVKLLSSPTEVSKVLAALALFFNALPYAVENALRMVGL